MATNRSPHDGHRARMRKRLKETSPSAFAEHEILEMLLYHSIARGDTNETAHSLLEAFGSIEGVLDADASRLQAVWGVGESSAVLLTLAGELARRYATQKFIEKQSPLKVLDTPEKVATFFAPRFIGATKELALVLLVDNSMRVLDCFPLSFGTVSGVSISVRAIAERAYSSHAAAVFLAHNHPGGIAVPSDEDVNITRRIKEGLAILEIPLVEHFVFSDNAYSPILNEYRQTEAPAAAASPVFDLIKTNFLKKESKK